MANEEHLAIISQGVKVWNAWREENRLNRPLRWTDLSGADLHGKDLAGVDFHHTDLDGSDLSGADLSGASLSGADLTGANLSGAKLVGSIIEYASVIDVRWDRTKMRGRYKGIRGLDSCFGNAVFKRAAADQDFLDSLEAAWSGTWRIALFWAWHLLDYGRSLSRVAVIGFGIAVLYGLIFSQWPELLDYTNSAKTSFTPFYFSVVTFTTLGLGDVKPNTIIGEVLVTSEVIIGYFTLEADRK
jgi:Pentapeptide repeats (8 copies)/Ion channel